MSVGSKMGKEASVSASSYICSRCRYVYDAPRDDEHFGRIPPRVPFEALADSWTCPHCGSPKEAFQPFACLGYAPEVSQSESANPTPIEETGTTVHSSPAVNGLIEIAATEVHGFEHSKSFFVPVTYLGKRIHDLALKVSGKDYLADKDVLSIFFEEQAIKVLKEHSANYFWFWSLVLLSACNAPALRIKDECVRHAIRELRTNLAKRFDLSMPLLDLSPADIALRSLYGVLILKHSAERCYELEPNPLFAPD